MVGQRTLDPFIMVRIHVQQHGQIDKNYMKTKKDDLIMQNKIFAWIAVATAGVLSIPLIMMQISNEWDWGLSDFIIIGALLFGAGFAFVHVARVTPRKYRNFIGIGFVIAVLYIWAELAVGIFTNLGS